MLMEDLCHSYWVEIIVRLFSVLLHSCDLDLWDQVKQWYSALSECYCSYFPLNSQAKKILRIYAADKFIKLNQLI